MLTGLVIMLGLPSAPSYSGMSLTVFGRAVLDLPEDTVGNFGLTLGALIIAVRFTRLLTREAQLEEFGAADRDPRRLLFPMLEWVIPGVLLVVWSNLLPHRTPAAWHFLPGAEEMDVWQQILGTFGLGVARAAATLVVFAALSLVGQGRQQPVARASRRGGAVATATRAGSHCRGRCP